MRVKRTGIFFLRARGLGNEDLEQDGILRREPSLFFEKGITKHMADTIKVNEQEAAPDFTLPAVGTDKEIVDGKLHLSDLKGHTVVLYFYPKDDTPGCTVEACNFRDANHQMQKRGIKVLGISADDEASHQKFAEKYGLPFTLLSDTDTSISQAYGVYGEKNLYGRKFMGVSRVTFLIDKEGVVRKVWPKVKPDGHAEQVLETVEALQL
jgi:peroxiredoxin Q/BCP